MDIREARRNADNSLLEHGLNDWVCGLNNNKRRLGVCKFRKKRIELSRYFITANDEDTVRDVILHEIAHALVGQGHGHDSVWKAKAASIGCETKCQKEVTINAPCKYKLVCPNCGREVPVYRERKRIPACGICCKKHNNGRYTDKYKLEKRYE